MSKEPAETRMWSNSTIGSTLNIKNTILWKNPKQIDFEVVQILNVTYYCSDRLVSNKKVAKTLFLHKW